MALILTEVTRRQSVGNYFEKIVDVQFDSSYASSGEALTAGDLGFAEILSRFDLVAVQEVGSSLEALRLIMLCLGADWGFRVTDVT